MTAQQAIDRRLALSKLEPATSFRLGAFANDLLARVQAHVIGLSGSVEHDVDQWKLDQVNAGAMYELVGDSPNGVPRVLLGFMAQPGDGIEVALVATQGSVAATWQLFGASGSSIGNRIHVARLLDLGVECAMRSGAKCISNTPVDDRVRTLYVRMGFENGERLDLTNPRSLGAMCGFVDQVYDLRRPAMPAFVRPW